MNRALVSELTSSLEIGEDEYENVDDVIRVRDLVGTEAAAELQERGRHLGDAYPFRLDSRGGMLEFDSTDNWGRTLYLLSLILSHLPSEDSPVLKEAGLTPTDREIIDLRRWFQYCATASMAAEIGGHAWAFGWPRPDQTGFLSKLKAIWAELRDGDVVVVPRPGAPDSVKDDEIDIIAARPNCDGMRGFPIALGQVASGRNWKTKPLRGHADHVFYPEWFTDIPASQTLVYHIIPFMIDPALVRRETRRLGHLMHRTRLCFRALEACRLLVSGKTRIEATQAFDEVRKWAVKYKASGGGK